MAGLSTIEWTNATWNPLTGCTKVSEGCLNCYAERIAKRLHAAGNKRYTNGFRLTLHRDLLITPLLWQTPKLVFVNSMSDLFHEETPDEFIHSVFETMQKARGIVSRCLRSDLCDCSKWRRGSSGPRMCGWV